MFWVGEPMRIKAGELLIIEVGESTIVNCTYN
jgi:hypothetical protein